MPDAASPLRGYNEARVVRHGADEPGVTLTERRLISLAQVAAWPDTAARVAGILAAQLGCTPPQGRSASSQGPAGILLALSPGRWLLESPDPRLAETLVRQIGAELGAVTDLSHARIAIRLCGPKATWVLNKGLAIDLHLDVFPPMRIVQSAIHEIGIVLRRLSPECFELYVPRGFALSFWHWLLEAAEETGYRIEPPGSA